MTPYHVDRIWLRRIGWHSLRARLKRRWRDRPEYSGPDMPDLDSGDDIAGAILLVLAIPLLLIAAVFLVPLLIPIAVTLLDLLLVALLALLAMPVVLLTKVVLGRPWLITVRSHDGVLLREVSVVGWDASSAARDALRRQVASGVDPQLATF